MTTSRKSISDTILSIIGVLTAVALLGFPTFADTNAVKTVSPATDSPPLAKLTRKDFERSECSGFFRYKATLPSAKFTRILTSKDKVTSNQARVLNVFDVVLTDRSGKEHKLTNFPLRWRAHRDNTQVFNFFWRNHNEDLLDLLVNTELVVKNYGRKEEWPELYFCTTFYANRKALEKDSRTESFILPIKIRHLNSTTKLKAGAF